jgi:SAM-dependent methyltransferase
MGAEFDKYDRTYSDEIDKAIGFVGQSHSFYMEVKAERLIGLAVREFGDVSKLKMLDVGCGVGLMSRLLVGSGAELHGIDIARDAVKVAREEVPDGHFRAYDGRRIPFRDNTFDVAFAVCVIHHVPVGQRQGLLKGMARVTKPGGLVVLFEANPWNPLTRLAVARCEFDKDAVLLGMSKSETLVRRAGLEMADHEYILFFPLRGRFWRATESLLRWFPMGAQYFVCGRKHRTPETSAAGVSSQ